MAAKKHPTERIKDNSAGESQEPREGHESSSRSVPITRVDNPDIEAGDPPVEAGDPQTEAFSDSSGENREPQEGHESSSRSVPITRVDNPDIEAGDPPIEVSDSQTEAFSDSSPEPSLAKAQTQTPEKSPAGQGWSSLASFTLEFQTREFAEQPEQQVIVQRIDGEQSRVWATLNDEAIYRWILDQVDEILEGSLSHKLSPATQPAIEITQIRCLQPATVAAGIIFDTAHAIPSSILHSNEPVVLEVSFQLAGMESTDLTPQTHYQIQGKFHNRITPDDIPLRLNQSAHLIEGQSSYTVRLPEVTLLPGLYRLEIAATLPNPAIPPATLHIPVLQVL